VVAIKTPLDRGYGKATQPIAGEENGAPSTQEIRIVTGVPRSESFARAGSFGEPAVAPLINGKSERQSDH
jgi:hypothetical protein